MIGVAQVMGIKPILRFFFSKLSAPAGASEFSVAVSSDGLGAQLVRVTKAAPIAKFFKKRRRLNSLVLIVSLKNSPALAPNAAAKALSIPPACLHSSNTNLSRLGSPLPAILSNSVWRKSTALTVSAILKASGL